MKQDLIMKHIKLIDNHIDVLRNGIDECQYFSERAMVDISNAIFQIQHKAEELGMIMEFKMEDYQKNKP